VHDAFEFMIDRYMQKIQLGEMNASGSAQSSPSLAACLRPVLSAVILLCTICLLSYPTHAADKNDGGLRRVSKGDKLFTQFSLFHEKNQHRTTNYRPGVLVPVNTMVTYEKKSWNKITVRLEDGQQLVIRNIKDYSGEDIHGIFDRTFSTNTVDVSKFSDSEQKAIAAGRVELGMSKAAVVVAIGYPPAHQTPSLSANHWRYWASRFDTFLVKFEDEKVVEIKE